MGMREQAEAIDRLDRALARRVLEETMIAGGRPGTSGADRLVERLVGLVLRASRVSGIPVHQMVRLPLAEVERLAGL